MERVPTITVKSLAEFARQTPSARRRTLKNQKFPEEGDGRHKIQYYGSVSAAIRNYFKKGKSVAVLNAAKNSALSIRLISKRENVLRAIKAFEQSSLRRRSLVYAKSAHYSASVSGILLKANPEMTALEGADRRFLFFYFKSSALDAAIAQLLANLAYWVLKKEDGTIVGRNVEVHDIQANRMYSATERLSDTERILDDNAKQVLAVWGALD